MSLDVYLEKVMPTEVYWRNITHNLSHMAKECGLHNALWQPEKSGYKKAKDLVEPLIQGLAELLAHPDKYKKFNPENGWGDYNGLVKFATEYLRACQEHPDADVRASV